MSQSTEQPDNTSRAVSIKPLAQGLGRSTASSPRLDVQVKLSPVESAPELDDESRPTDEYVPLEGRPTDEYHPPVGTLLDRLSQPEVAAVQSPYVGRLQRALLDVDESLGALARIAAGDRKRLIRALGQASERINQAAALLHEIPDEEELVQLREDLQSRTAALEAVVQRRMPAPRRAEPSADHRMLTAAERSYRKARRRRNLLVAAVAMLALGRLAMMGIKDSPVQRVEATTDRDGVTAVNHTAGATEEQLSVGLPSVMEVRLEQDADGDLVARAVAFDPDGDPLQLSYRWFREGALTATGTDGRLPENELVPGARYSVEVRASDGKHTSRPVASPPVTVKKRES